MSSRLTYPCNGRPQTAGRASSRKAKADPDLSRGAFALSRASDRPAAEAAEALLQTVTCRRGRPRPPKQTDLRPFLRALGLVLGRGCRRVVVFGRAMLAPR